MLLGVHMTSVLFLVQLEFCPDYGLLLELHALTQVARSYVLLLEHLWYFGETSIRDSVDPFHWYEPFLSVHPSLPFLVSAGDIYYIVVPIVVVVVILKLCLIFWRVWVYQKVRTLCTV